jgi:hypothetical protein
MELPSIEGAGEPEAAPDSMTRIVAARYERVKVRPRGPAVAAVDRQWATSCLDSPGPVAILAELSGA